MNSPLSFAVLEALNSLSLPNGISNQINSAQVGVSGMQELQEEIGYYEAQIDRYTYDILRIYLFDEEHVGSGIKEVIDYLEVENCPRKKCLLASSYIDNNQYTDAQLKIDTLTFDSTNADYCNLYNSIIQFEQDQDKEYELISNSSLRTPVENVAVLTTQKIEVGVAQTILEQINSVGFNEPFDYVSGSLRIAGNEEETIMGKKVAEVNLYPNPNNGNFTVSHDIDFSQGFIELTVFDMVGKVQTVEVINGSTHEFSLDIPSGVYFYRVTQNGELFSMDKLIVY